MLHYLLDMEARDQQLSSALADNESLVAAAHELKAPLVLIRQLALLLQDDKLTGAADKKQIAQRIELTSERSMRLVEALTRSTRLSEGDFALEPVQTSRLCEDVAHELTPLLKAMDRKIELHLPKQPTLALAHHELLRSATLGLCDNALTHTTDPKRPIVLSVKKHSSDSAVRLSVRDYGPHISKDIFSRLRERLGKMPQPISEHPAASGLGLYIAGQFAEAMNGRIGAIAHRQVGATFFIETQSVQQLSFLPS